MHKELIEKLITSLWSEITYPFILLGFHDFIYLNLLIKKAFFC